MDLLINRVKLNKQRVGIAGPQKFNDVILNPINNVNASMFNVISVIITHT